MIPVLMSAGGFRLLVGVVPIVVLTVLFGLLSLVAMACPKDRRDYVVKLAPYFISAIKAVAAVPRSES